MCVCVRGGGISSCRTGFGIRLLERLIAYLLKPPPPPPPTTTPEPRLSTKQPQYTKGTKCSSHGRGVQLPLDLLVRVEGAKDLYSRVRTSPPHPPNLLPSLLYSPYHPIIPRSVYMNRLDNAGKTTLMYKMTLGSVVSTAPTVGSNTGKHPLPIPLLSPPSPILTL